MAALPGWVDDTLHQHKIHIERYGRNKRGGPTREERRWFFCGWYYHRTERRRVVDGPHGPFPCKSAAMTDALRRYRLADTDR